MPTYAQPQLLTVAPSCSMKELLDEAAALAAIDPEILRLVDSCLDAVAVAGKRKRQSDAEWKRKQQFGKIVAELEPKSNNSALGPKPKSKVKVEKVPKMQLTANGGGRPRTPAAIVLAGVFIRGHYGSLTAAGVRDRLKDSSSFCELLWRHGLVQLDPTVLARHVNNLSDETIERIQNVQIAGYLGERLDNFELFSADSTSIRANAQWPNDSSLIFKKLRRATRILVGFENCGWCLFNKGWPLAWLEKIRLLARDIDLCTGKTNAPRMRKKLYKKLVRIARKLAVRLGSLWDAAESDVLAANIRPTHQCLREKSIEDLEGCIVHALHLIDFAEERTQYNPKVERDEHEKITGVIEQDAEIIYKGGREPNFGYKLQAAFSLNGFVTALILDKGNVSDSASMIPLLDSATSRTGVVPKVGTVDDGYSSKENWRRAVKNRGLEVMSISGSKGRNAIDKELYESEPYRDARRIRGKLEFPFFVLKRCQEMDRMKRTGLLAVRREITEKTIAFNAVRAIQLRKQLAKAAALARAS